MSDKYLEIFFGKEGKVHDFWFFGLRVTKNFSRPGMNEMIYNGERWMIECLNDVMM